MTANMRLSDAFYDAGGQEELDLEGNLLGAYLNRPFSPIAAAVRDHYHKLRDLRRSTRIRVPLQPDALAAVIDYARERVAHLVEIDKALKGGVAKGLRAWRRLKEILEAERKKIAA